VPDIHHVPFPRSEAEMPNFEAELKEMLHRVAPPDEVAAIFIEPIQGEGGYHVAPPKCLPMLRELCDRHNILLVVDEVQCGMGRTGKFCAYEHWNIEPDIICLAKGLASGMPIGAIIARDTVMDWPSGSHASTFGGNPVSCRAALATLDLLQKEYMVNAEKRGQQLGRQLIELEKKHACLRHSRGLGLMRAVDIVDPESGDPAPELKETLIQSAFEQGLLLLGCGEHAIRFCPPLCVTEKQIDIAVGLFDRVLAECTDKVGA
jgi:4-aminobutyrate aminotransferase